MSLKVKYRDLSVIILCTGIFITGTVLRYGVYNISVLQEHSPLLYVGLFCVLFWNKTRNENLSSVRFERKGLIIYTILNLASILIIILNGVLSAYIRPYITLIFFTGIILFRFKDFNYFETAFRIWMFFLKLCVFLMFFTEVVDLLTNNSVTVAIANYTNVSSLARMVSQGRSVTYMGHPLFSAEVFLTYYLFYQLSCKLNNKKGKIVDFCIPLIGAAIGQARSVVILLILSYILFNCETKKALKLVAGILAILIAYQFGLFDSVIERTLYFISKGDISAGRNSALTSLISTGTLNFEWFSGQRLLAEDATSALSMALEYPILQWTYLFGIFITILLVIMEFIYPLAIVLLRRQKEVFIALLILIADVNSYAGLSTVCDKPIFFYIVVCIMLNISNVLQYRKNFWSRANEYYYKNS